MAVYVEHLGTGERVATTPTANTRRSASSGAGHGDVLEEVRQGARG